MKYVVILVTNDKNHTVCSALRLLESFQTNSTLYLQDEFKRSSALYRVADFVRVRMTSAANVEENNLTVLAINEIELKRISDLTDEKKSSLLFLL